MRPALILATLLAIGTPVLAQVAVPSRETVQTGLPWLDDIEIRPDGTWIVSFPQQDQVVQMQPGGVPVPFHSGRVQGMSLDPVDGSLWVSDFLQGTVSRIDLSTYQVTQVIAGFDHPLEVSFLDANRFVVGRTAPACPPW